MKKKIIISIIIIILLSLPFLFLNEGDNNIKEEKVITKKEKYKKKSKDNINDLLKENVNVINKENIVIERVEIPKEKFKYNTNNYDNILFLLKEEVKEEIVYNYIIEENFLVNDNQESNGLKLIDGKRHYYDFETGELINDNVKKVIDISSWQGDVDFEKVRDEVDMVIVRIGYGTTLIDMPVIDNKFLRNIEEIKKYNIAYGLYFYGYAQNIFASNLEVKFVSEILNKFNIPKDTYIFYDAEINTFNNIFYSRNIYEPVVNNFINSLNNSGYINTGLYSNYYMLTSGSLNFNHNYPVWVAEYNTKCHYEKEYVGWQFSSKERVNGIDGKVDMSIFYEID